MKKEDKTPFTLQLFVTENCNLKCRYCYEGMDRSSKIMDLGIAKAALERTIPALENEKVTIDVMGGEPLIAFDFIKGLAAYVQERRDAWKKECTVFISTNGTLLDDKKKAWFARNKDSVVLGLSLDGTPKAHDLNRSGSYASVEPHLPFFRETWPWQPVKMTINAATAGDVYDGILNIYSNGLKCSANVVFENVWGEEHETIYANLATFASELDKLVEYFAVRPDMEAPGLILDLPIQNLVAGVEKDWKWCGAGKSMRCVYIDGSEFACHRFATLSAKKNGKSFEDAYSIDSSNSRCARCAFLNACPSCDAFNFEVNGSPYHKTDYHCELIKLQMLATARLRLMRLNYELMKLYHVSGGIEKLAEIKANIDSVIYVAEHMDLPEGLAATRSLPPNSDLTKRFSQMFQAE